MLSLILGTAGRSHIYQTAQTSAQAAGLPASPETQLPLASTCRRPLAGAGAAPAAVSPHPLVAACSVFSAAQGSGLAVHTRVFDRSQHAKPRAWLACVPAAARQRDVARLFRFLRLLLALAGRRWPRPRRPRHRARAHVCTIHIPYVCTYRHAGPACTYLCSAERAPAGGGVRRHSQRAGFPSLSTHDDSCAPGRRSTRPDFAGQGENPPLAAPPTRRRPCHGWPAWGRGNLASATKRLDAHDNGPASQRNRQSLLFYFVIPLHAGAMAAPPAAAGQP